MAFDTIPLGSDLMAALGLGRNDLVVALEADLIRISGQQLTVRRGMGIMAIGAFP